MISELKKDSRVFIKTIEIEVYNSIKYFQI
jgi:hypothetical protein